MSTGFDLERELWVVLIAAVAGPLLLLLGFFASLSIGVGAGAGLAGGLIVFFFSFLISMMSPLVSVAIYELYTDSDVYDNVEIAAYSLVTVLVLIALESAGSFLSSLPFLLVRDSNVLFALLVAAFSAVYTFLVLAIERNTELF